MAAQKNGLLPISQHALKFYGHLAYHGYEGVALDLDERDRLVADLGEHRAMILANHGLLVAGANHPRGVQQHLLLERACQAQVAAMSGGAELVFPPEEVRVRTAAQFNRPGEEALAHYDSAWISALRLIEGDRPDYRG